MTRLSRRRLLAASGLAAGSLFLPSLLRRARADAPTPPRRFVVVYTQHGTVYDDWRLRRPGLPEGEPANDRPTDLPDWEFDLARAESREFGPILRPLHAFRDRLLVLDGLSLATALWDQGDVGNHYWGRAHSLTGARAMRTPDAAVGGGASVDQVIANAVRRHDRFASLELAVAEDLDVVLAGPGQVLPAELEPNRLFRRIFGTSDDPQTGITALQPSVLDQTLAEFDQLRGALSAEDRRKLETHRDMIRDLELRLDGLAHLSCEAPPSPGLPEGQARFDTDTNAYPAYVEAFSRLTAAALACDLTRVVTLQLPTIPSAILGGQGSTHDMYAHKVDDPSFPQARALMSRYHALHATQLARLCELLDAIPEGDGTVLDHTLIFWANELSTGTHTFPRWPVVLAGGGAGFRMGRCVRWHPRLPTPVPHPSPNGADAYIGPPHNRLLTSLGRAFGADLDHFGESTIPSTARPGHASEPLDLTGPLDRLV